MEKIMKWLGINELVNTKKKIREQRKIEDEWTKKEIEAGFYIS